MYSVLGQLHSFLTSSAKNLYMVNSIEFPNILLVVALSFCQEPYDTLRVFGLPFL